MSAQATDKREMAASVKRQPSPADAFGAGKAAGLARQPRQVPADYEHHALHWQDGYDEAVRFGE